MHVKNITINVLGLAYLCLYKLLSPRQLAQTVLIQMDKISFIFKTQIIKLPALSVDRFLNAEFLILTINKLLVIPQPPHSTINKGPKS